LSPLKAGDRERISEITGKIRRVIAGIAIPQDIDEEITRHLAKLGEKTPCAVRSSATAEDLPTASFAGQQDTYLNIIGKAAILQHISKCWASLFTERAVTYRIQNNFDHRKVYLSVVVQKMAFPQAAGIMFTADPITSNRKVLFIDAGFGLGEALVSGLVNADIYKVREGRIIEKKISTKKLAIYALEKGGTEEKAIEVGRQNTQTLTDGQILQLEGLGRKIEAYFGRPQDIEWCLDEEAFYIVQSRPITTLYPVPDVKDGKNHVYLSFGHQQMMTEAMKPLGITFYQPFFKMVSGSDLVDAGGRFYMDVSSSLTSRVGKAVLSRYRSSDVLGSNALFKLMERKDFIKTLSREKSALTSNTMLLGILSMVIKAIKIYRKNDAMVVEKMIVRNRALIRAVEQQAATVSGDDLFDLILQTGKKLADSTSDGMALMVVGGYMSQWLNKNMQKWLGEKNVADTLAQSVSNNATSDMGLDLLDVADVVRRYPEVIEYFQHASDETFFEDLARLEGGEAVNDSIWTYLEKYGMRCSGEIDITRPRWSEKPNTLIPAILSNIRNFEPGAHRMKYEQGRREAEQKAQDLLSRLERLPGGKRKVQKTKKAISVLRNFIGYREYPKYFMVWYFWVIKQALLREAARLVQKGVIWEKEDIYYLSFEELREVVKTNQVDYSIITKRKEEHKVNEKLTPPRVMTSEGEIISGEYDTINIPQGALVGVPVSSGIIEGRARVVVRLEDANIEEGDILVTTFTDPSWTPLFVSVKGLVTEVGGIATHGAIVAREYGLPAVVGVENATKLIKDGQRIRVNGTEGYVEIL
jgi:phosphoenolpyruvate synthase/pyruvate phosphate dikinase